KRAYCLKTQPATGETYPKSDLFNKATVVIKTGKRGCFIKRADMKMEVPAVSGITAIDTIGAGDNFASGFISALLEGKPLRECALFANATAAISVLSVGATTGVKNRKLVEQLLDEYEG
ncbi:PfkB family carbohydrate kinase, partial [Klebsiella pneumoniae]|uniref:PfkB family carbohydrate kinase n=1 Tax=Klebsiella pneumoniae TaxID=573 RepID=UPI0039C2CD37